MTNQSKVILAHVVFLVAMVAVVWAGTAWAGDVEEVTAYRVHGRTFDTLEDAQEHEAYTEAREFVVRATGYSEPTEANFISHLPYEYERLSIVAQFLADYPDETLQFLQSQHTLATISTLTGEDIDRVLEEAAKATDEKHKDRIKELQGID